MPPNIGPIYSLINLPPNISLTQSPTALFVDNLARCYMICIIVQIHQHQQQNNIIIRIHQHQQQKKRTHQELVPGVQEPKVSPEDW